MSIQRTIFRKLSKALAKRKIYLTKSLTYRQKPQTLPPNFDYIRYATFDLCHEEIVDNNIPGAIAELGVYRGDLAKRLNQLFPDRKLYLFDTFEGFQHSEINQAIDQGDTQKAQDFSETSVELVLGRMPNPDNCIVRQGVFPESAKDLEETYCMVSLDADLYEPILAGLKYFYPRLSKGGYIIVHDYNNEEYKGVRKAVQQYAKENGISYSPIPDGGGSVIIAK